MSQDLLEKVRLLVRLAAESNNVEEARNAALQACKRIHEHGLRIEGMAVARGFARPARTTSYSTEAVDLDGLFDALFGNDTPKRWKTAKPAEPPPQPAVQPKPKRADPDAKSIPILDPAWCTSCGQRILRGRFATWSKGSLYHPQCWKNETE